MARKRGKGSRYKFFYWVSKKDSDIIIKDRFLRQNYLPQMNNSYDCLNRRSCVIKKQLFAIFFHQKSSFIKKFHHKKFHQKISSLKKILNQTFFKQRNILL